MVDSNAQQSISKKPLYHAEYSMTSLMCEEATHLLSPSGVKSPAGIALMVSLVALVAYCIFAPPNNYVAIGGAIFCFGLLLLTGRGSDYYAARFRKLGIWAVALSDDERQFLIDVYEDRIEVNQGKHDIVKKFMEDVKGVKVSDTLILIIFKDSTYALIPVKSMSFNKFNSAKEWFSNRLGKRKHGK